MNVLRWILVIPSAVAGWFLAFISGLLLYGLADYFCPPELMISDMCVATWHKPIVDGIVIFGASLAAVLAILFPVLVAPKRKQMVAVLIFVGGVIYASYLVIVTATWGAFIGAVTFGAISVWSVYHRVRGANAAVR